MPPGPAGGAVPAVTPEYAGGVVPAVTPGPAGGVVPAAAGEVECEGGAGPQPEHRVEPHPLHGYRTALQ